MFPIRVMYCDLHNPVKSRNLAGSRILAEFSQIFGQNRYRRLKMGKKGSQLQAFKSSLAAITRPTNAKRRQNKQGAETHSDPDRNQKLKSIEQQFNAFETKFTRTKHEVVNRKVKGK